MIVIHHLIYDIINPWLTGSFHWLKFARLYLSEAYDRKHDLKSKLFIKQLFTVKSIFFFKLMYFKVLIFCWAESLPVPSAATQVTKSIISPIVSQPVMAGIHALANAASNTQKLKVAASPTAVSILSFVPTVFCLAPLLIFHQELNSRVRKWSRNIKSKSSDEYLFFNQIFSSFFKHTWFFDKRTSRSSDWVDSTVISPSVFLVA